MFASPTMQAWRASSRAPRRSAAIDIVLLEVSTDAGLTGWGDAFGYVCPRSTATAIEEMIAPQAQGLEVPDAAGIPAFMERIQRNLHLFGRYGITMFAISGLDIALWDLRQGRKAIRCID